MPPKIRREDGAGSWGQHLSDLIGGDDDTSAAAFARHRSDTGPFKCRPSSWPAKGGNDNFATQAQGLYQNHQGKGAIDHANRVGDTHTSREAEIERGGQRTVIGKMSAGKDASESIADARPVMMTGPKRLKYCGECRATAKTGYPPI